MREPALEHGMTWERFRGSREKQRDELLDALEQAPPWMQEGIEFELSRVWFELQVAGVYLEEEECE